MKRRVELVFRFHTPDQKMKTIPSVFYVATMLIKSLVKQCGVYFVTPYSKNNGMTQAIFDFFTLVKFRALSLVSEEIVYSDNVSPCPERVDYI